MVQVDKIGKDCFFPYVRSQILYIMFMIIYHDCRNITRYIIGRWSFTSNILHVRAVVGFNGVTAKGPPERLPDFGRQGGVADVLHRQFDRRAVVDEETSTADDQVAVVRHDRDLADSTNCEDIH